MCVVAPNCLQSHPRVVVEEGDGAGEGDSRRRDVNRENSRLIVDYSRVTPQ